MGFDELPPFVLVPLYIAALLMVFMTWFIATPIVFLTAAMELLMPRLKQLIRLFKQFDEWLSNTLDELWKGIV